MSRREITRIGFVGLGVMGAPMARHVAARFPTTVYDVDAAKARLVASAASSVPGAPTAATAGADATRAAARLSDLADCDLVVLSLPASSVVHDVCLGGDGLASVLAEGSLVVDASTTDPAVSVKLASGLRARGIAFVDAPVSGGEGGAKAAALSVMCGGNAVDVARARPVLECFGSSVVHVGDVGAGGVAKLVNNMIVGATFAVVAEGFALAGASGLDPDTLYQAIRGGWAGSPVLDVAGPAIAERDYTPGGTIDLLFKDIGYALSLARAHNVPTPMTALTDELLKAARAAGYGAQSQPAVIELWGRLGAERDRTAPG